MDNDAFQAWNIKSEVPGPNAPLHDILYFAIRCAVLAPSSHNSQPWQFRILKDGLMLILDRRRALPAVDPYDRELIMSCGAALFNIRVALAFAGTRVRIDVQPDSLDADLLARITVEDGVREERDEALAMLFAAISKRMTNRSAFWNEGVAANVVAKMDHAAGAEWAKLSVAAELADRETVAELVAAADLVQFADARFRRELASWLHPEHDRDGLSAFSSEMKKTLDFATPLAALVVRTFDVGSGVAAKHKDLVAHSPLLACISTTTDDASAWLAAGQALQRVLLVAVNEGLDASYLNQPIEVASFRQALADLMHTERFPQLLIRLGRGLPQAHSPRRVLEDVIS